MYPVWLVEIKTADWCKSVILRRWTVKETEACICIPIKKQNQHFNHVGLFFCHGRLGFCFSCIFHNNNHGKIALLNSDGTSVLTSATLSWPSKCSSFLSFSMNFQLYTICMIIFTHEARRQLSILFYDLCIPDDTNKCCIFLFGEKTTFCSSLFLF